MPVIVMDSNKGGVGKTTTAILIGTTLASQNVPVVMLDADKTNHSLTRWKDAGAVPDNIEIISDVGESNVVRLIRQHDKDGTIVIVDLEAVASLLISRAISQADLVLIPIGDSSIDALVAGDALRHIKEEEEVLNRPIAHAAVLTSTNAPFQTYEEKRVRRALEKAQIEILEPSLNRRATFKALFFYGGNLYTMKQKGGLPEAIENAEAFAKSVFTRLTKETMK